MLTLRIKSSRNIKGFTIIEVLIVLAIAALILLIVFLAEPALQRNARNTQKDTDASRLAAALNEYYSANSNYPSGICASGPNKPIIFARPSIPNTTPIQVNLGFYNSNTPGVTGFGTATSGNCTVVDQGWTADNDVHFEYPPQFFQYIANTSHGDHLLINIGDYCDNSNIMGQGSNNVSVTMSSANASQFAIVYVIETGSGTYSIKCINS